MTDAERRPDPCGLGTRAAQVGVSSLAALANSSSSACHQFPSRLSISRSAFRASDGRERCEQQHDGQSDAGSHSGMSA